MASLLAVVRFASLIAALASPAAHAAVPMSVAVAPGVFAIMGEPGEISRENLGRTANIAFIVGPRGVVVIDAGVSSRHGEAIIAAVRRVTARPIRLLVITHASREVVFGAAAFKARGIPILMHADAASLMASRCETCLTSLREIVGERAMAGSRIVTPDRLVAQTRWLDVIGRPLMVVAPARGSAPGAIAVLDITTRTLITGTLVLVNHIPDLRDARGGPWRGALALLASTHCRHLVPGFGPIGSCADILGMDGYFAALDQRVHELLTADVGLAELPGRCDLPEFSAWLGYAALHGANANREYLRMERAAFADRDWNSSGLKD